MGLTAPTLRVLLCLLTGSVTACREQAVALNETTPVISMTLVAGDTLQSVSVTVGARADSQIPSSPGAPDLSTVQLDVLDESGVRVRLVPVPAIPGRFQGVLDVRPGRTYRLSGTVGGRAVSAETTVPSAFLIQSPASDTIGPADGSTSLFNMQVPYMFNSDARAFEARTLGTGGAPDLRQVLSTSSGTLVFLRTTPRVGDLILLAYNIDAAEWLARGTPRGNVTGAFGGFGAALQARRWVRLQ